MTRRSRSRNRSAARKPGLIALLMVILLAGWFWQQQRTHEAVATPDSAPVIVSDSGTLSKPLPLPEHEGGSVASDADLPAYLTPEARDTLRLIARGGPFPHPQDGSVFGNREKRLPGKSRGYYHEYTVETPGLGHRGARRIITGG
ncbi:MAG: ribonuclease domain-containing protein, partial [Pseudoxanthomonas sp.]